MVSVRSTVTRNTGQAVADASFKFRHNPSSDNWMILEKAMKAHQVATLTLEETLEIKVAGVKREDLVRHLANYFDDIAEAIEKQAREGHITLIRSEAA